MTRDRLIGNITSGFPQKVEFVKLLEYYTHRCHLGHNVSKCLVMGHKMEKLGKTKPKSLRCKRPTFDDGKRMESKEKRDPMTKGRKRKDLVRTEPP